MFSSSWTNLALVIYLWWPNTQPLNMSSGLQWQIVFFKDGHNNIPHPVYSSTDWPWHSSHWEMNSMSPLLESWWMVTVPAESVREVNAAQLLRPGHEMQYSFQFASEDTYTQSPELSHKKSDYSEDAMLWESPGHTDGPGVMFWSALPVFELFQPRWATSLQKI